MSKQADQMRSKRPPALPPTEVPPAPTEPPASTEAPTPPTGDPLAPPKAPTWEQRHQRATFHLPRETVAAVRATAKAEGLTASAWVARALGEALDK